MIAASQESEADVIGWTLALLAMAQVEAAPDATDASAQAAADGWGACLGQYLFERAITSTTSGEALAEQALAHCAPAQQAMTDEHERWLIAAGIDPERADEAREAMRERIDDAEDDLADAVRDARRRLR